MWVLSVLRQPNLFPIYCRDIVIFPHPALSSFSVTAIFFICLCLATTAVYRSSPRFRWNWFLSMVYTHTHTNIHTCSFLWYVSCARVCVHVDSLEESQKARRSLLCYLLYKYNMIVLSLSFPLALSCVSGSCSLLLQVLIINDWDIKKPKKQFLLRFFDSHRVAFDSLLFFFFLGFLAHVVQVLNDGFSLSFLQFWIHIWFARKG